MKSTNNEVLHYAIIPILVLLPVLGPNVRFSIFFSNTHSLYSFLTSGKELWAIHPLHG